MAAPLLKKIDSLAVRIYPSCQEMALAAAESARDYLQNLARQKSHLAAILATGNSQIAFLTHLTELSGIDWQKITLFHLDEFLGVPGEHPASFQTYFRQRVESRVTPAEFHYIQGDCWEPAREGDRYAQLLAAQAIDFCCLGVGQNGHLAFNEPEVANFQDTSAIKLVKLAESTRQAQVGNAMFPCLEQVPHYAFTLTLPTIFAAAQIYCFALGTSKAKIVRQLLTGKIDSACPASWLRRHANATLFLDVAAASLLD